MMKRKKRTFERRISVYVHDNLMRKFKAKIYAEGRTTTDFFREKILEYCGMDVNGPGRKTANKTEMEARLQAAEIEAVPVDIVVEPVNDDADNESLVEDMEVSLW